MKSAPLPYEVLILVCTNQRDDGRSCCADRGSESLREILKEEVKARGLKGRVRVSQSGCLDQCAFGPTIMVFPEGIWYSHVTPEDLPEILARHLPPDSPPTSGESAAATQSSSEATT